MIPNQCKMPDISVDYPLSRRLLVVVLGGFDQYLNDKEKMYLRIFIRLVDKVINEYNEARNAIIADIQDTQNIHVLEFIDHFENCINAVNRLLKQLEIIKSGKGTFRISRLARQLIEAHSKSIPDIRNVAEHLEEKIYLDEVKSGEPVMVSIGPNGDRAVLGSIELMFDDLATTIRHLYQVGIAY